VGCLAALFAAGCGGGTRQDADEPKGRFPVEVLTASFPESQKLAKRSNLVVTVRNSGDKTIPNIAVSVDGFSKREQNAELADPNRPLFVINGVPRSIGGFPESQEASPPGGGTAYVNTWALGKLAPGKERSFRWSVTAVKAGPFRVKYTVAAGLNGKAKAVDANGRRPVGSFAGTISDKPPVTRVSDDGQTVVHGTR
jgi:hypothetical protein